MKTTKRTLLKRAQMDPHAAACDEGGGTLVSAHLPTPEKFNAMLAIYAPGCGCFTHVAGTNGGRMRCGATLTMLGKTDRYFCAACSQVNKSAHD